MPTPRPGRPVRGSVTGRPLNALLDLLGRRWAMRILWELRTGPCTFRVLQARCGGVSPTVLNQRIREFRETALVETAEDGGYQLTALGAELGEAMAPLKVWADRWDRTLADD
jgi:DNA-binding HxlR family transcriptional regulator